MRKRRKITDWLNDPTDVTKPGPRTGFLETTDTLPGFQYLLNALRSQSPGQWSANLLELSRHFTGAIFLAANTLAQQAAASDCKVWERTPDVNDADLELGYDEQIVKLLRDPNNEDDTSDLLYGISQQLSLTGIALIWHPQENALQIPSELYVIPTATALPWPPSPVYPRGSYLIQPYYPYGPFATVPSYASAAGARIPAEQIIRIKNIHPILRYDGYAVLTAIQRQIDTVEGIDLARWQTQQKGADPMIAVEFDPEIIDPAMSDMARIRQEFENLYSGPLGKKIWLSPPGSKVTKIDNVPKDMAWQEGWRQLVDFAMAAYGVPKSIAGLQEDMTYSNLYAALRQFYILSLEPHLGKIANKLTKRLVRKYYGDDLYMTLTGRTITDEALLETQLGNDLRARARTYNEWRLVRKLPPIPGPKGNEFVGEERITAHEDITNPSQLDKPDAVYQEPEWPDNKESGGSLPKRKNYRDPERLATVFERYKTNGTIQNGNGKH